MSKVPGGRVSEDAGWYACTAEGARVTVREQFGQLSLKEKVAWLEEAETVALKFKLKKVRDIEH